MQRLRLIDLRLSRLPEVIGKCQADVPSIAQAVNDAQERLLMCKEAGDDGWYGTFAEIALTASRTAPYVTMPREVARVMWFGVCGESVEVNNQFFEYLQFGNGRLPQSACNCRWPLTASFMRNNVPTFLNLASGKTLQVFASDPIDMDGTHRVLIQGTDTANSVVYSQDGLVRVTGQFLTLTSPFAQFPLPLNSITGIQKDVTAGPVQFWQYDPATGESVLILTMEPGETTASYRRYYIDSLPNDCCDGTAAAATLSITAMAKLELIPVAVDTDYLLIPCKEAIIEECAAIKYAMVDTPAAKQMAADRHRAAIGFLNGQLAHYLGIDKPAVSFKPFGSASLERVRIGMT